MLRFVHSRHYPKLDLTNIGVPACTRPDTDCAEFGMIGSSCFAHGERVSGAEWQRDAVRNLFDGRGTDSVIDAVGMEAHGSPIAKLAQQFIGLLPDAIAAPTMRTAGLDRLGALYSAIDIVRRGRTISVIGVYGGKIDPLPLMTLFDKQIQLTSRFN